eukprot:TRINITY_DN4539_c0_g1_i1.p1 TRINITY_DN4539_c0_g1~~TRINITY_DN4539_c0_g1_i1.p1  ORF type:complete len:445 (-),score=40.41 TRINITY_DN4539_c0_g1_i1:83-1417(-)
MALRESYKCILSILALLLFAASTFRSTRSSRKAIDSFVVNVPSTRSKSLAPAPRKVKDFYEKLEKIGEGGFGNVFLAKQVLDLHNQTKAVDPNKRVVIKEVQYKRYENVEDEVMALNLPFVADMEAKFTKIGLKVSLVTRYYEGGDLLQYVIDRGRIRDSKLVRLWGSQMAYGLWQLHRNQVLYGDLKLENTFITEGNVVLADFGLSTRPCPNEFGWACQNKARGSPSYVTPSILNRVRYGFEIDWWALGVVLFLMQEGQFPFPGETDQQMFQNILAMRPMLGDGRHRPSNLVSFLTNVFFGKKAFEQLEKNEVRARMVDRASLHPILKHHYWHGQTDAQRIDEYWYGICKNHSVHKENCAPVTAPPRWASRFQASIDAGSVGLNSSDGAAVQGEEGCSGAECGSRGVDDSHAPLISEYPAEGLVCFGRECKALGMFKNFKLPI